jgi:hypothetical protein
MVDQECSSNLMSPGGHALPLAQNIAFPPVPLMEASIPLSSAMVVALSAAPGDSLAFVCLAPPNTFPNARSSAAATPLR